MAFNQKEQAIIQWGLDNNKTKQEVVDAITNFRTGLTPERIEVQPEKQNIFQEAGEDIRQIGTDIKSSFQKRAGKITESREALERGEQGVITTGLQQVGQGAGLVSDFIGNIFKGGVKALLPQKAETAIKGGIEKVATPVMESEIVKDESLQVLKEFETFEYND